MPSAPDRTEGLSELQLLLPACDWAQVSVFVDELS